MQKQFEILIKSRELILKVIENLTNEQLNKIPKGFNNNIIWNIAHLMVTQQLLCYKFAGLKCLVSEEMIENFRKGTAPTYTVLNDEVNLIIARFQELPKQLKKDYDRGLFDNYKEYTTSVNVTLRNIDDAIYFNTYHEGIHMGIILQLIKCIEL